MSKNTYQAALDEVVKTLETIDSGWKDIDKTILSASKNIRKISAKSLDSGLPKDVDDRIQKIIKERENILNAIERQRLAELKLQKDRENAFDKFEAQLKREQAAREAQVKKESQLRVTLSKQKDKEFQSEARRLQQQAKGDALQIENQKILSRNAREAAVLGSKLAGEYQKQEVVLNQLRRRYKDLAIAKSQNIKLSKEEIKELNRLQKEVVELEGKFKRVDASVGQFQRNVGNYGSAFRSLGGVLRSTASAFGIMTGSFLAASIIKNGIDRIREFDKEMQNMAGITRTSRSELKDLEGEIISVAGSSIKTSNEVAKLATSLLMLGKTKEEVKQLLKPTNDLSIALNATSEEAGEFLIQTLNSFGKGTESASEFADIIATISTRTTLDFQKMVDSFQYLSPISRALGKDLAYTGAVIGILADNGLKAESAGRLLGTAQQKLAKQGKSLVEALDEINAAQKEGKTELEVLALASNLFGAQAGKVGIILANNTDVIEENAQAIRENGGALDELVGKQLESLDAKIKILDSTWEEFLLTLENGEGTVASFFKGGIELATDFIKLMQQLGDGGAFISKEVYNKILESQKNYYKELGDEAEDYAKTMMSSSDSQIKSIEERIKKLKEEQEAIKKTNENEPGALRESFTPSGLLNAATFGALGKNEAAERAKQFAENEKLLEKESIALSRVTATRDAAAKVLGIETEAVKENIEAVEKKGRTYEDVLADISAAQKELQGSTADEAPAILYRIGVLQKKKEAWEQRGKAKKESSDTKVKDAFDLEKSRAERAIEIEKEISENKDLETDLRLEANQRFLDESLALLEIERVNAVKEAVGRKDAIQKINEEAEHERLKLIYESEEKVKEIFSDSFQERMKAFSDMQDGDARSLDEEIMNLKRSMLEKGASVEEIEGAIEELRRTSLEKQLQDQIDFALKELEVAAMTADERLLVEEELHKLKKQLLNEEFDAKKDYAAKEKELNQDLAESKREMYGELQNLAYDAVNGIFDAEVQKYDERIAENSDYYNALLENEGLTEDARADIEKKRIETDKKLQEKREQVEKRAFMINQGIKAAQIVIDTIQKVAAIKAQAAVLAANPFGGQILAGLALAQIPFVIGTGAAAAGAVLAQSIPAFAKGKDENDPYEGPMLWGEKQAEVKRDKKGNIEVATKPTLGVTKKGDTIFPSIPSYLDSLNMDALNHAAIMTSLKSQSSNLDEKQTGQVLTDQIENAIWRGYDKIKPQPMPAPDYNRLAIEIAKEFELNKKANV